MNMIYLEDLEGVWLTPHPHPYPPRFNHSYQQTYIFKEHLSSTNIRVYCLLFKTLEKILCEKSKTLKELTKQVKSKSAENRELDEKLKELQVSLAERVHIENLAGKINIIFVSYTPGAFMFEVITNMFSLSPTPYIGVAPSEASHEKRMEAIIKRCKLVDTIKSQDEEYSVLKEEVERLRMRTFPALVQVD